MENFLYNKNREKEQIEDLEMEEIENPEFDKETE
jgi:hypothetical protein